jgi:glycosyltransferase involved in cell wall biosynthesis
VSIRTRIAEQRTIPPLVRLGVYSDLVYRADGEGLSADMAFVSFVAGIAPRVEELVVFGRLDPEPGRLAHPLPPDGTRFVPLPHYPSVRALGSLARSVGRSRTVFAAELDRLDAVWLFGPHPLALVFAHAARRRGVPVFLGVRQDIVEYVAKRLPSRAWGWAVPVARGLDAAFRRVARTAPTVVVGEELRRRYAAAGGQVLASGFSLVRPDEVAAPADALARSWDGELRLLSVGRVDPEKNPLLLPEVLALLRRRDPRWRLTIVGSGPLEDALRRRVDELGLADAVELAGYVPLGPELWRHYRESHAFLHVSLTEGLPQVLFEAHAAGLPIVATDVGGVSAALGGGRTGLLVPPRDAHAAADAVDRLRTDVELRRRLVEDGLEVARRETMDAQLDRLVGFFRAYAERREPAASRS